MRIEPFHLLAIGSNLGLIVLALLLPFTGWISKMTSYQAANAFSCLLVVTIILVAWAMGWNHTPSQIIAGVVGIGMVGYGFAHLLGQSVLSTCLWGVLFGGLTGVAAVIIYLVILFGPLGFTPGR